MLFMFLFVLSEADREKVEKIYEDHHLMLYRISLKMLMSDADAQDAVAQTFLKIMEHIDKINTLPVSEVTPYCVVIAKNASYDILRRKNKLVFVEEIESQKDDGWNLDERLLKEADEEQLMHAMEKLSDADRYLLELRFAKDLEFKEIAKIMGLSEDAAKKRGPRVLKKLKALYLKEGER